MQKFSLKVMLLSVAFIAATGAAVKYHADARRFQEDNSSLTKSLVLIERKLANLRAANAESLSLILQLARDSETETHALRFLADCDGETLVNSLIESTSATPDHEILWISGSTSGDDSHERSLYVLRKHSNGQIVDSVTVIGDSGIVFRRNGPSLITYDGHGSSKGGVYEIRKSGFTPPIK